MKKLLLAAVSAVGLLIGGNAYAAYVPTNTDASMAILPNGQTSVSGLTNALSYACGISIGDGSTHTVSTAPAGSCFNGVTTLAGLAAIVIDGKTPFSFLTAAGSTVGPLCSYGSTTNCFTNGAYSLTNSSVANMDIAWLAIQAAMITKRAYIPAGVYEVGTSEALPLMIPTSPDDHSSTGTQINIKGDGPGSTFIQAGSSFGTLGDGTTVIPLMSCGDPGATPTNTLGRWVAANGMCSGNLSSLVLEGTAGASLAYNGSYRTDGLALGARLLTTDVTSSYFDHDITLTGDHAYHLRLHANGGIYGVYWTAPNSVLVGDFAFADLASSGQSFASIDVDGAASMQGYFDGETYLNAGLYAIYGENNGCAAVVGQTQFRQLMTEYLGLGAIEDGHNFSGGTYTDGNKCRGVAQMDTQHWFMAYSNSNISTGTGRRRRATIDVSAISGHLNGLDVNGGGFVPVADNIGAAGIAVINTNGISQSGFSIGLEVEGMPIEIFNSGVGAGVSGATVPFFSTTASGGIGVLGENATWKEIGGNSGIFLGMNTEGNYTVTKVGDLMEILNGTYETVVPAGYSANQPAAGIAVQAGLTNGMVVPLQTRGEVSISQGYHNGGGAYQQVKYTGTGPASFVAGTGGTTGTYTIAATGGGCTTEPSQSVTVAGGAITAVTTTNSSSATGCTSAPSVSTSSITGLSGGSITLQWPAAESTGGSPNVGILVGFGTWGSGGSTTAGTSTTWTHLLNLP